MVGPYEMGSERASDFSMHRRGVETSLMHDGLLSICCYFSFCCSFVGFPFPVDISVVLNSGSYLTLIFLDRCILTNDIL